MVRRKVLAGAALVGVIVLVLVATAGCGSSGTLPANVLARVGKTDITQDQLNAEVSIFKGVFSGQVPDEKTSPAEYKDFLTYVLDHMITYEVASQKAASLNISVTDQELQDHVDQIKQNTFGGDQAKFDAALTQSGMTMEQLKTYYQQMILIQKAYAEVTKNTAGPSDAEISSYYDSHKSSFFQKETRAVRHILITPSGATPSSSSDSSTTSTTAGPDQWAAALAKAQKVRQDLVDGADWKTEAAQYSNDPGTKDKGGALGAISKGQMVTEFDQAAFSLAKDEISQPVKTVYGYHIIQVTAINAAKQLTLAEAKSKIQTTLLNDKKRVDWDTWLAKTKTELKLAIAPGMETTTSTLPTPPTSSGSDSTTAPSTESTAPSGSSTTTP